MEPDTPVPNIRSNPASGPHPEYGAGYSRTGYTAQPCWWSTSGIWSQIFPYRIYSPTLQVVYIRNIEPDTPLQDIRSNPAGGPHPECGAGYSLTGYTVQLCWWSTSEIWSRILPYKIYGPTLLVVHIRNMEPDTPLPDLWSNPAGGPHPEYGARYSRTGYTVQPCWWSTSEIWSRILPYKIYGPTLLVVHIRNMEPDTPLPDLWSNPAGGPHPEYGAGYSRTRYTV